MKKIKILIIAILGLTIMTTTSCKKEEVAPTPTNKRILTFECNGTFIYAYNNLNCFKYIQATDDNEMQYVSFTNTVNINDKIQIELCSCKFNGIYETICLEIFSKQIMSDGSYSSNIKIFNNCKYNEHYPTFYYTVK